MNHPASPGGAIGLSDHTGTAYAASSYFADVLGVLSHSCARASSCPCPAGPAFLLDISFDQAQVTSVVGLTDCHANVTSARLPALPLCSVSWQSRKR